MEPNKRTNNLKTNRPMLLDKTNRTTFSTTATNITSTTTKNSRWSRISSNNNMSEEKKTADNGRTTTTSATDEFAKEEGPEGCYLTFDPASGGRLMLFYSRGEIPNNAIGFWCPGPGRDIQGFKFKQAGGRVELIKGIAGGDQNRRKYYSGWCQFIKLAKQMNGYVIKFPNSEQGVEVDIVAYKSSTSQPYELDLDEGLVEVGDFDAVAVIPKHNSTFRGIKSIVISNFLELGNLAGASTMLN